MSEAIEIKYACSDCGLMDVAVDVPCRGPEDAKTWVEQTMLLVARDHCFRSPCCRATHVKYIKIPANGRNKVGGPLYN